jgi:thioredoxin reductase
MDFWQSSMPRGMHLKSEGRASSLYDPRQSFNLSRFCAEKDLPYADFGLPVALDTFITSGIAFQKRFVPSIERCFVSNVKAHEEGFSVCLDSGETFTTRGLIVAVGVGYFAYMPSEFNNLPHDFVSHSSGHGDLSVFESCDVAIVGAGASALDLAALLDRAGARPVVISRHSSLKFHDQLHAPRNLPSRLRAPMSGVGTGWLSWIYCKVPLLFHYLPEKQRVKLTKTKLGPIGGWFVKDAVVGRVPTILNSRVEDAAIDGDRVRLRLRSEDQRIAHITVDHVITATGYLVDINRITFLDESLRTRINTVENSPILSSNFESSIPGLYFVGPVAANSFGPLQRFAVGARFAARRVSRNLARTKSIRYRPGNS